MAPKKKLSKKERARLEAEQAEALRIEMERERQIKLEEERRRKQIEREQAMQRLQEEIALNKVRRTQLKDSMVFFDFVNQTIGSIRANLREQSAWAKYMRCNGLPDANSPSDLRRYLHQWEAENKQRERESRNWLLRTDERTLLTQNSTIADLSSASLRRQQGKPGDVYAKRIQEILGILAELDEALSDTTKPAHILADLRHLKMEIRLLVNDHIDEFTHKIMSHIERDMEIDRPGVSKHIYSSPVFKCQIWTFSKDAQISLQPKSRLVEQTQPNEIDFPVIEMSMLLPHTVPLQTGAIRALWLNYDHFSDYCSSFRLKQPRRTHFDILRQTKREWRKRKEILLEMVDNCDKNRPAQELSRDYDIDKLYTEYEDELNEARRKAIGPEAYHNLLETDINLRKYRIIGGVYCLDLLETPEQDKRLNARSFIRTIDTVDCLHRREFYQTYVPPPAPQPGVRRLPEEIEAEMRMIEAALEKLAYIDVQLPDSVIWFEPPITCCWETPPEDPQPVTADTTKEMPSEPESLSTSSAVSPRKKPQTTHRPATDGQGGGGGVGVGESGVREIVDFDLLHIPPGLELFSLLKAFVAPRLPIGFKLQLALPQVDSKKGKRKKPPKRRYLYLARPPSVPALDTLPAIKTERKMNKSGFAGQRISGDFIDLTEPRECFPVADMSKNLQFKSAPIETKATTISSSVSKKVRIQLNDPAEDSEGSVACANENANGAAARTSPDNNGASVDGMAGLAIDSESRSSPTRAPIECYMFSELIQDLDALLEMEAPLQEDAIHQISTRLNGMTATLPSDAALTAPDSDAMAADIDERNPPSGGPEDTADPMQPKLDIPPPIGISFFSDLKVQSSEDTIKQQGDEEPDESSSDSDIADEEEHAQWQQSDESDGGTYSPRPHNQSESDGGTRSRLLDMATLKRGKWSTRDIHDAKFNEDKVSMQFRTGRLGIFGFALNRYSNMPYQAWEIKPDFKSPGTVLFSFTAAIVSMDMSISAAGYCMNNFQGGSTSTITAIIGKMLTLDQLQTVLITSAVDIFPDDDAFCYTEGSCEKNYGMEMHTYTCVSTLALSHNFGWSRWNLLAGSRTAILLMRELIEGKKVPYHSTLLVTPQKTAIIDCTEVSPSFNSTTIAGMEYYADLYQLSQAHILPSSLAKQRTMDPMLRDNVAQILMAIRPLSFC